MSKKGNTSHDNGHLHAYEVDENGNGWALEAVSPQNPEIKHKHVVTNWIVAEAETLSGIHNCLSWTKRTWTYDMKTLNLLVPLLSLADGITSL